MATFLLLSPYAGISPHLSEFSPFLLIPGISSHPGISHYFSTPGISLLILLMPGISPPFTSFFNFSLFLLTVSISLHFSSCPTFLVFSPHSAISHYFFSFWHFSSFLLMPFFLFISPHSGTSPPASSFALPFSPVTQDSQAYNFPTHKLYTFTVCTQIQN